MGGFVGALAPFGGEAPARARALQGLFAGSFAAKSVVQAARRKIPYVGFTCVGFD